jgi:hypothetical protein
VAPLEVPEMYRNPRGNMSLAVELGRRRRLADEQVRLGLLDQRKSILG